MGLNLKVFKYVFVALFLIHFYGTVYYSVLFVIYASASLLQIFCIIYIARKHLLKKFHSNHLQPTQTHCIIIMRDFVKTF